MYIYRLHSVLFLAHLWGTREDSYHQTFQCVSKQESTRESSETGASQCVCVCVILF